MPLDNFSLVSERHAPFRAQTRLFRSGQPDDDGFLTLARLAPGAWVLSLSEPDYAPPEAGLVTLHRAVSDRVSSSELRSIVRSLDELLDEYSVLVHCAIGRDRTGAVIGAYRLLTDKWSFDEMMLERRAFGPVDEGNEDLVEALDDLAREIEHAKRVASEDKA